MFLNDTCLFWVYGGVHGVCVVGCVIGGVCVGGNDVGDVDV